MARPRLGFSAIKSRMMDTPEYCICEQYTILSPQTPSPGWRTASPPRLGIALTTAHPAPTGWEKVRFKFKNHDKTNNKTKINYMSKLKP